MVLVALHGRIVADAGRIVAGKGAAEIQSAKNVSGLHQIAGLEIHSGALGGALAIRMVEEFSALTWPETVFSAEMVPALT
ncbi:MAG: hypothetical protein V8R75_07690 [Oscillospiraceae bacterium]